MSNTIKKKTAAKSDKRSAKNQPRNKAIGAGHSKAAKVKQDKPSKRDQILTLLHRPHGASLEEMQKASGWQRHSVRGFLSGTVKRKLGLKLSSARNSDGERRYGVAS